jgi:hypothetical protein
LRCRLLILDHSLSVEQAHDARLGNLQYLRHIEVGEGGQSAEGELSGIVPHEYAIERERVEVWIEPEVRVCPLDGSDGAALSARDPECVQTTTIPVEDRVDEGAAYCAEQLSVEGKPSSELKWQRQNPLAERGLLWNNMLHEVGCRFCHSPTQATGAEASTFAGKPNGKASIAVWAAKQGEAMGQNSATHEGLEFVADEGRQRRGEAVFDRRVERAQIVPHHPVQRTQLGAPSLVTASLSKAGANRTGIASATGWAGVRRLRHNPRSASPGPVLSRQIGRAHV